MVYKDLDKNHFLDPTVVKIIVHQFLDTYLVSSILELRQKVRVSTFSNVIYICINNNYGAEVLQGVCYVV